MSSKLILYFIKEINGGYYSSIRFCNKIYEIEDQSWTIDIDKKIFNEIKEKIIIELDIIPANILKKELKYKINIFYGINKAYLFLDDINELLIEYNYIDNQKIFYKNTELKEYDENGLVKRLILINCPTFVKLENKQISFPGVVEDYENYKSFEIIDCDFKSKVFGIKPIICEEKFNIIKNMRKQKYNLENFFNDIKSMIRKNIIDKNEYKKCFSNYNIEEYEINFSQKKDVLKNEFNSNEDYYLMFLYWFWYSIKSSFLNDSYKCNLSVKDIFDNIIEFYNLYLNDKELLVYQKILLFYSHSAFFLSKNNIKEYKATKIKYINRKNILNDSVYKLSFDFLNEFILKLNTKSYLFFPLLMLDSGNYRLNNKKEYIYGFNRESCDVIKSHLNELLPDVFFEYSEKGNLVKEESSFNYKGFRVIFLNRLVIFKNFKKDPFKDTYKNDNEKKIFKHYGMLASKTIMHESFGHNKIIFDKKDKIVSPSRFYNKQKKLVKIVPALSYKKNKANNEYLKSLNEKLTCDSDKFFEYFFGKYDDNKLIIDLIFQIDYIGNLLDNVDYFVKEDLDELKKYIINKYKISNYNDIKYDDKNLTFEQENIKMEEIISDKENKIKKEIKNKEEDKIEIKEENEKNIFTYKKDDIIFLEEDCDQSEGNIDENQNSEEEEEEKKEIDSLPFFIALHKA